MHIGFKYPQKVVFVSLKKQQIVDYLRRYWFFQIFSLYSPENTYSPEKTYIPLLKTHIHWKFGVHPPILHEKILFEFGVRIWCFEAYVTEKKIFESFEKVFLVWESKQKNKFFLIWLESEQSEVVRVRTQIATNKVWQKLFFFKLTLLKICENSFNYKVTWQLLKIEFFFWNLFPHLFEFQSCYLNHVTWSSIVLKKNFNKNLSIEHTEKFKSKRVEKFCG